MKKLIAYHGTKSRFSRFEQSKARLFNDFYGGGVAYFTSELDVAKSYAKTMFNRYGGEGMFVYKTELRFNNIFDVDNKFTGKELVKLIGDNVDQFARGAKLLTFGEDPVKVKSKLRSGEITLSGDQVFRGLSNGMQNTAFARRILQSNGYDGLRYNGGQNMSMSRNHDVYLVYDAANINILSRHIVSNKLISEVEKREVYSYI